MQFMPFGDICAVADQKIMVNTRAGYHERVSRWLTYLADDVEVSGDSKVGYHLELPGLQSDGPERPSGLDRPSPAGRVRRGTGDRKRSRRSPHRPH